MRFLRSVSQLKKEKLFAFTMAIFPLVLSCEGALAEEKWRTFSRRASIDMSDRKYQLAAVGYQRAMELLPVDRLHEDARLDLLLGMADNSRRERDFSNCRRTLTLVKVAIDAGKYNDPLLPARYWRREVDLMRDLGLESDAIKIEGRVLRIIEKHFDADSAHFKSASARYISRLVNANRWLELLDYLQALFPKLPEVDRRTQLYDEVLEKVRGEINRLIALDKLALARGMLIQLQKVDTRPSKVLDCWWNWHQACQNSNQMNLLSAVEGSWQRLALALESSRTKIDDHAAISCHALLACLYQESFQPSKEAAEWKAIDQAVKTLGQEVSNSEYISMLDAFQKVSIAEESRGQKSTVLLRLVEITRQPGRALSPEERKKFDLIHLSARYRLVKTYLKKDELEKAEAALNNFDLDCVKRLNRGVRLARFHASLGEAFLAHGKLDRARAHFAAAKRWIDAFTVKPNNKSDWEQTLAVIRRLQIGIAQKEKSKL